MRKHALSWGRIVFTHRAYQRAARANCQRIRRFRVAWHDPRWWERFAPSYCSGDDDDFDVHSACQRHVVFFPMTRATRNNHATASVGDTQYTDNERARFRSLRIHVMGKVLSPPHLTSNGARVCVDLVSSRLASLCLASPRRASPSLGLVSLHSRRRSPPTTLHLASPCLVPLVLCAITHYAATTRSSRQMFLFFFFFFARCRKCCVGESYDKTARDQYQL